MDLTILRYDTIDSTNSEAVRQAKKGAREGLCITADEQTAGRGRLGRAWQSPKGAGLYFSILLRPNLDPTMLPLLTLMAAVSVHDTLTRYAVKADIKWVNDLLVDERKICGILSEATDTPDGLAVVVGIGINVEDASFPPELKDSSTSIEAQTGRKIDKTRLTGDLCDALAANYDILSRPDGPATVRELWAERSSYAIGKTVTVRMGEEEFEGVTKGIEVNGALRVETAEGELRIVQAGEVSRLRTTDPA